MVNAGAGTNDELDGIHQHDQNLGNAIPIGIVLHQDGSLLYANRAVSDITGYSRDELPNIAALERIIIPQHKSLLKVLLDIEKERPSSHYEIQVSTKDGGFVWLDISARMVVFHGRAAQMISLQDITRYKVVEEQLIHNAMYDLLTGLSSRSLLEDRLREALAHARRTHSSLALALIDLKGSKEIYDVLGSQLGDEILIQASRRLSEQVRESDTLARGSENDFILVLNNLKEPKDAEPVLRKLMTVFSEAFICDLHQVYLDARVGFAVYPIDGSQPAELFKNAAVAMAYSKNTTRDHVVGYESAMHEMAVERLRLTASLRHAIEHNQLVLHYQPVIDLRENRVIGLEALTRWQHPEAGLVPPDDFLPLAEESGLIHPLGRWVIREACNQAAAWQQAGLPPLRISINISPLQLEEADLVDYIAETVTRCKIAPDRLAIEITERTYMGELQTAARRLQKLRALGVRVDIDDFGTVYASLAYLRKLPVDSLKIDRIFIQDLLSVQNGNGGKVNNGFGLTPLFNGTDAEEGGAATPVVSANGSGSGIGIGAGANLKPDPLAASTTICSAEALTRAIIMLGHGLNMQVVAEGVETDGQLRLLRSLGCNMAQGFLFSPALPADQVWEAVGEIDRLLGDHHPTA